MKHGKRILIVDDHPSVLREVAAFLAEEGFKTMLASSAAEAWTALHASGNRPDLVVLDIRMPGETGLDLLARLPHPLPIPVVVLSGEASISDTVQALKLGATDFIEKPPTPERLVTSIRNALAIRELEEEQEQLLEELAQPGSLVGDSTTIDELRRTIARVGPSETTVLVQGETGTGKERVARALHRSSGRKGRYVAVNCAAIPGQLLESELFGYEKGAFSGAVSRRIGKMEQADRGTLLLDEIGDMPMELQAKLLRAIEERAVERLGGNEPVAVNARIIAATHCALEQAVKDGGFREDLYYRLNVFPVVVPPLRERQDDIIPLIRAFAAEFLGSKALVTIEAAAESVLKGYRWPGNVRELRNYVERMCLLKTSAALVLGDKEVSVLGRSTIAAATQSGPAQLALGQKSYRELVEDFERSLIRQAMEKAGKNVAAMARLLGVDRGNLYRRIQALGLSVSEG
ncbi:MAG: sigma-54 dependent transcriptional regulator [Pseudomonadota bacterium]